MRCSTAVHEPGRGGVDLVWRRRGRRAFLAGLLVLLVSACGSGGTGSREPASGPVVEATTAPAESAAQASPSPEPQATSPRPSGPVQWRLAWSDEFDGPAGTPPDPASWSYQLGDGVTAGIPGWGNNEREYYTDSTANAATDGKGNLLLTARIADGSLACYYGPCEYTSARLLTRDKFETTYGRIEARLKVPSGEGFWPAVWMLGNDIGQVGWPKSGEIDVMEYVGRRPSEILGTIHGPGYYGSGGISTTLDLGVPVAGDFHTFAVEWLPDHIAWFVDGRQYAAVSAADVAPNRWVFDHPFYLILNVAIGGNLGGSVGKDTVFPQSMAVDYVRVYEVAP